MEVYFRSLLRDLEGCQNEAECRARFVSISRMLIQQVDYALLEWISKRNPPSNLQPSKNYMLPLWQPADGSLIDALEALLISAEQIGWSGASRLLMAAIENRPASRICEDNDDANLLTLLRSAIARRNDGAEGHGLVGGYDSEADIDTLRALIDVLHPVLPKINTDNSLSFGPQGLQVSLLFLRVWDGKPCLLRKIKAIASDKCRVYAQRIVGPLRREDFHYETCNPFSSLGGQGLPQLTAWENSWNTLCYVPDKTTDAFTGRESEINDLVDWANDEGARACLIFGDGGYGKTTLAIEFIHEFLDEDRKIDWRPSVVIFYTAKRTQWGLSGLSPVGVGQPHLIEMLAQIHQLLFSKYPDSSFYRASTNEATGKLQTKIKNELGYAPKDILLVIDNTETLISNEEERNQLGKELRDVGRRIGRVLLTSRRRELMDAVPIHVDVLSEEDALKFIRKRGYDLSSKVLNSSSDAELLKEIVSLERRPIVLEAFINAASAPGVKKIRDATSRVASMLQRELGEFLFADAWGRFTPNIRRILLLMTRVGDAHDAQSLRICSDVIGVPTVATEQALEESGGIASVVVIQGQPQISFTRNFVEFSKNKTIRLNDGTESPSSSEISKARDAYSLFLRDSQKFTGDRVGEAFRIPQARAAHQARQNGKYGEARRLYEAAILSDATNGWLRDRFAYFLFHDIRDNVSALHQAKKAVDLLPEEGEVWFTRGLIEARQGDTRACEISLKKAGQLGVSELRCDVQRVWAYLKHRPVQLPIAKKLLEKIDRDLASKKHDSRIKNEMELLRSRYSWLHQKYGERL
jgi:hypothetical protein